MQEHQHNQQSDDLASTPYDQSKGTSKRHSGQDHNFVQQLKAGISQSPQMQEMAQLQAMANQYSVVQRQTAPAAKEDTDPVYDAIDWGSILSNPSYTATQQTSLYTILRSPPYSWPSNATIDKHIFQHLRDKYYTGKSEQDQKMVQAADGWSLKAGAQVWIPTFEGYRQYMKQRADAQDPLIGPFYQQHLAQYAPEVPAEEEEKNTPTKTKQATGDHVSGYVGDDAVGTLHIAWTFDDGPTAESDDMEQVMGGDRATWYVVRRNIMENKEANLKALKAKQDAGGEIAIHSPHPTIDHINWFKTRGQSAYPYPGYPDIGTAIADLRFFKKMLDQEGITPRFVRVPGGMVSELTEYAAALGADHSLKKYDGAKTAAMYLAYKIIAGDSYSSISKVIGDTVTHKKAHATITADYQALKAALNSMNLLSWGGDSDPMKIEAQSWDAESSGTGLSNTAEKRSKSAVDKIAKGGKDRSMVILAHDTRPRPRYDTKPKALNVAAVEQTKREMERYAMDRKVQIEYHTMSSLFQQVTGKNVDEIEVNYK